MRRTRKYWYKVKKEMMGKVSLKERGKIKRVAATLQNLNAFL